MTCHPLKQKFFSSMLGFLLITCSMQVNSAITVSEEEWATHLGGFPSWYYEEVPEYCEKFQENQTKCSSGDSFACYQVGLALMPQIFKSPKGHDLPKASRCPKLKFSYDTYSATQYFLKACNKGDGTSCFEAAQLKIPPFDSSYTGALFYYEKGCDAESVSIEACRHAGKMYRDGEHVKQNLKMARKYFAKGCSEEDEESCLNLADMHEKGQGGFFKSKSKAKGIYGKLCEKGNLDGCRNYKRLNQ